MKLLHLTAVGLDRAPATLEFAPQLTVVYGASDTGKSYVIEAIDFVFGASTLRDLPEAAGYRTMLLGIEFDAGDVSTLARDLRGGKVSVYNEDIRVLPDRPADRILLGQHQKQKSDTISYFLLERLGIADAKLRKNSRNVLQSMSFRNIAHLILVDEERMQSRTSPVETGIPTSRTAELSAFKLLLEGEDDSALVEGEDSKVFRQVNHGQIQVLDRAIEQVRDQLANAPERAEALDLLARVNASIQAVSGSMAAILARRDQLIALHDAHQRERSQARERASEATSLFSRFSLLDAQYAADLARLEMVKEAGTLLGYFDAEACVFCGAAPEHQRREHAVYETVQLAESVDAEAAKTAALRADLALTLQEVQAELDRARTSSDDLNAELRAVASQIRETDEALLPAQADLNQLIARRSQLERWIEQWARVADLRLLCDSVAQERPEATDPVTHGITSATQRDFTEKLRAVLTCWQVPDGSEATFTFTGTPQIKLQNRSREDRGKGIRSVLHAAFTVALSEYCVERELPHPGFVALDTPVLTYRDADHAVAGPIQDDSAGDELLSGSVAKAFYLHLGLDHLGQTLVVENQTPPEVDAPGCKIVYFSGNPTVGRAGFYPCA